MSMKSTTVRKLVLGALFLALGLLLPFLTGQVPQVGSRLLPMHIPVLLCGFACGWKMGLFVGLATPIIRSLWLGMPPLYPQAVTMAFELAAYAVAAALLYSIFKKQKTIGIYISLIGAMLCGRVVWGLAALLFYGISGTAFSLSIFMSGAFINAVPGIILQIVVLPPIIMALRHADLLSE